MTQSHRRVSGLATQGHSEFPVPITQVSELTTCLLRMGSLHTRVTPVKLSDTLPGRPVPPKSTRRALLDTRRRECGRAGGRWQHPPPEGRTSQAGRACSRCGTQRVALGTRGRARQRRGEPARAAGAEAACACVRSARAGRAVRRRLRVKASACQQLLGLASESDALSLVWGHAPSNYRPCAVTGRRVSCLLRAGAGGAVLQAQRLGPAPWASPGRRGAPEPRRLPTPRGRREGPGRRAPTCSTRPIHWKLSSSEASGRCSATSTTRSSCSTVTENTAILSTRANVTARQRAPSRLRGRRDRGCLPRMYRATGHRSPRPRLRRTDAPTRRSRGGFARSRNARHVAKGKPARLCKNLPARSTNCTFNSAPCPSLSTLLPNVPSASGAAPRPESPARPVLPWRPPPCGSRRLSCSLWTVVSCGFFGSCHAADAQWRPRSAGCGSTLGCSRSSRLSLGRRRPTPSRLPGLPRSEQSLCPQATSAPGGRARRRAAQGAAAALTAPCGRSHPQREDGRWHLGRARRCAPTGLPCGFLLDGSPTPAALTGRRQQAELPLRRQEPLWLLEGLFRGRVWPGSQAPGPSNESTS